MRPYSIIHHRLCPWEIEIVPTYCGTSANTDPCTRAHTRTTRRHQLTLAEAGWVTREHRQEAQRSGGTVRLLSSCQAKPLTLAYTPALHKSLDNSSIQDQKKTCRTRQDRSTWYCSVYIWFSNRLHSKWCWNIQTQSTPHLLIGPQKWDGESWEPKALCASSSRLAAWSEQMKRSASGLRSCGINYLVAASSSSPTGTAGVCLFQIRPTKGQRGKPSLPNRSTLYPFYRVENDRQ